MTKAGGNTLDAFEKRLKEKVPALAQQAEPAARAEAFADGVVAKLREARRVADLTQAQVAERMGVDQSFIAKLEKGRVEMSLFWLGRYCEALRLQPVFRLRKTVGLERAGRLRGGRRLKAGRARKAALLQDVEQKIGEVLDIASLLAEESEEGKAEAQR